MGAAFLKRHLSFFGTTLAIVIPLHTIERFSEKKPWANAPRAFFFDGYEGNQTNAQLYLNNVRLPDFTFSRPSHL